MDYHSLTLENFQTCRPLYYLAMGYGRAGIGHPRTEGPQYPGPPKSLQDALPGSEWPTHYDRREPDATGKFTWHLGQGPPAGSGVPREGTRAPRNIAQLGLAPLYDNDTIGGPYGPPKWVRWGQTGLAPLAAAPLGPAVAAAGPPVPAPDDPIDLYLSDPADPGDDGLYQPAPVHLDDDPYQGLGPLVAALGPDYTPFPGSPALNQPQQPPPPPPPPPPTDGYLPNPQYQYSAEDQAAGYRPGPGGGAAYPGVNQGNYAADHMGEDTESTRAALQSVSVATGTAALVADAVPSPGGFDFEPMDVMMAPPPPPSSPRVLNFASAPRDQYLYLFPGGHHTRHVDRGPGLAYFDVQLVLREDGTVRHIWSQTLNVAHLYPQPMVHLPLSTIFLGRDYQTRDERFPSSRPPPGTVEPPPGQCFCDEPVAPVPADPCGKIVQGTFCEDRDHAVDAPWAVCDDCSAADKQRYLRYDGLWTPDDTASMRVYCCEACIVGGALSRETFERRGLRVWGWHEEPGRPSARDGAGGYGGFMGEPWGMSGCGDCTKLFGPDRVLCRWHRGLRADAVRIHAKFMREWITAVWGSQNICPLCKQRQGLDEYGVNPDVHTLGWSCLACYGFVKADYPQGEGEFSGEVEGIQEGRGTWDRSYGAGLAYPDPDPMMF